MRHPRRTALFAAGCACPRAQPLTTNRDAAGNLAQRSSRLAIKLVR